MYTDHSMLKYLVNKPMLGGGRICRWLLLFQEYNFEVVVKHGCLTVGPDHLLCIETGEETTSLEEGLPDTQLFAMHVTDGHFEDIIHSDNRDYIEGILRPAEEGTSGACG